jgi:hypothetical protein
MTSEEEEGSMGSGSEKVCDLGSEDSGGDGQDTLESVLWMSERNPKIFKKKKRITKRR